MINSLSCHHSQRPFTRAVGVGILCIILHASPGRTTAGACKAPARRPQGRERIHTIIKQAHFTRSLSHIHSTRSYRREHGHRGVCIPELVRPLFLRPCSEDESTTLDQYVSSIAVGYAYQLSKVICGTISSNAVFRRRTRKPQTLRHRYMYTSRLGIAAIPMGHGHKVAMVLASSEGTCRPERSLPGSRGLPGALPY
jgi:hypothetical protein